MDAVEEQFGTRLIRVIKNVKRRTSDGGTKTIKQSFHVKKANPGDEYAGAKQRETGLGKPLKKPSKSQVKPVPDLGLAGDGVEPGDPENPNEIPRRIVVRYHDIAWDVEAQERDAKDPVPKGVRDRFDPANRAARERTPVRDDSLVHGVRPTDDVLWGMNEAEVLTKLRTGRITRLGLLGAETGLMRAKLEIANGTAVYAYIALESLADPYIYLLWGELYELEQGEGSLARRAAASYEVAKAAGFDDIIPPTVVRNDRYGDLEPILPADLLERKQSFHEALARRTGEDPNEIRRQLMGYSWLQLVRGDAKGISSEAWLHDIFKRDGEDNRADALNNIFDVMPPERRMSMIRIAILDFILWTADRGWGDITFCDNPSHPVHVVANDLTCACPRRVGQRVLDEEGVQFVQQEVNVKGSVPMLWSEPLLMLAARGKDEDILTAERVGDYASHRMKKDRANDLARAMIEYGISPLQVAGVLSRVWMLASHAKEVARDPFFAARYYAQVISDGSPPEMQGVVDFVNNTMSKALVREFDFVLEMKESEEPEEEEEEEPPKEDTQPESDNVATQ